MPARFACQFENRQFQPVLRPGSMVATPVRFSRHALWGPKKAEIAVRGDERSLFTLIDYLRYGVTITDQNGTPCWWGFVNEMQVTLGAFTFGLSLDPMANKIAVAYTLIAAGQTKSGTKTLTTWAQDDLSVTEYGTKELLSSLSDAYAATADRTRDALLMARKVPVPTIAIGQGGGLSATLHCRGWQDLLSWRYVQNAGEGARYIYVQSDGETFVSTGSQAVGQTFQLGGAFGMTVTTIQIRARLLGSPSANLTVDLHTNSSGVPGTLLATRSVAPGAVGAAVGWITFDFTSANVVLQSATTYWLVISGITDASNAYAIGVSTASGYGSGAGYAYTFSWASAGWDVFFQVAGTRDTVDVIRDLLTTYASSIFSTVVGDASGVTGSAYGDGDSRALAIVEDHLNAGTTSSLRLLAAINPDRSVSLIPEPINPLLGANPSYLLYPDGSIRTVYGIPVEPWFCPCGGWARLQNVIPAAVDSSTLASIKHFFLEEAEYDVASNRLTLTPRGQDNVLDFGGIG
jgi:hypothetical protein